MVQLSRRSARPLLKTVAGKPHASDGDREGPLQEPATELQVAATATLTATLTSKPTMETVDAIFADPESSGDESSLSSIQSRSRTPPAPVAAKPAMPARSSARARGIRAPPKGTYARGKAGKARQAEEDKENSVLAGRSQPPSLASPRKRAAGREEDKVEEPLFGFEHRPAKRRKVLNIHAPAASTYAGRKTFGKPVTFGRSKHTAVQVYEDDGDDLSDVSLEELCKTPPKKKTSTKGPPKSLTRKDPALKPPSPVKDERRSLFESLAAYREDPVPTSSQPSALPNLDPNISGASTPLSSPPDTVGQTLQELEQFAADIPADDVVDKCPLCEKSIDPEHYREFFEGKTRTVRQQQQFCHDHTKRTALHQYRSNGYPTIDWDALPKRIRRHHDHISSIIKNEKPSTYRNSYVVLASERKTGATMMEENAELATQTGYYGQRGSRAMMEAIMAGHKKLIHKHSLKDTAVGVSGVANFVLRVLVPELTLALVMEDYGCGEKMAVEVIEESGEIGGLVHEDVGDTVVAGDGDDEVEEQGKEDLGDDQPHRRRSGRTRHV